MKTYVLMMGRCYSEYQWPMAAGSKEAIELHIKLNYPSHKIHQSEPHIYKTCEVPSANDTYLKIAEVKSV